MVFIQLIKVESSKTISEGRWEYLHIPLSISLADMNYWTTPLSGATNLIVVVINLYERCVISCKLQNTCLFLGPKCVHAFVRIITRDLLSRVADFC